MEYLYYMKAGKGSAFVNIIGFPLIGHWRYLYRMPLETTSRNYVAATIRGPITSTYIHAIGQIQKNKHAVLREVNP